MKFRDKKEVIGIFLGAICFFPSFFIALTEFGFKQPVMGVVILIVTQSLWLASITLATFSLELENRNLKEQLKELKNN